MKPCSPSDITSYSDYDPFGMGMSGRSGGQNDYRYSFNGMEKDDEISGNGNSLTTPFRMYNPRLGRWMSTDPITHAMYSPYSAFDNNPIYYSDPSGADSEKNGDTDPPKEINGKEGETAASGGAFAANGAVVGGTGYVAEDIEVTGTRKTEGFTVQSDNTTFNGPAPNFNLGIDYSRFLEKSWDIHTSYEYAELIAGGSLYTTVHTPPKYGTWDNGPIIETGYTTYGGYNASLDAGVSFDGCSTLSVSQYVNNSVFSKVQSGARTSTSASTFGEFLNYNKEWSTTYSKNNNAMFKSLYNSWSYGASIGVSVHPLGNYTYGKA